MSTNLVSSIAEVLGPEVTGRIASGLGLDKGLVQKSLSAGVPALLAAFTSLASKPGGAAKLADAVTQQQPGVITSLANAIGGSGQKALIDTGASALTSLLGGSTMSALTNAIGRYAGIGAGGSKGLMGLLGPVVMGVLGQQQRASGLDATGLANLLASQKDNIARALPAGFSKYLGETGILDRISDASDDYARRRYLTIPILEARLRRIPEAGAPSSLGLALSGPWDFSNRRPCLEPVFAPGRRKQLPRFPTKVEVPRRCLARRPSSLGRTRQRTGWADRSIAVTTRRSARS